MSIFDETSDHTLPLLHLLFGAAAQGKVFIVVIPTPPDLESIRTCQECQPQWKNKIS
jgi:hypothetical protein